MSTPFDPSEAFDPFKSIEVPDKSGSSDEDDEGSEGEESINAESKASTAAMVNVPIIWPLFVRKIPSLLLVHESCLRCISIDICFSR